MRKATLGRWAARASRIPLLVACDGASGTAASSVSVGTVVLPPATTGDGSFLEQSAAQHTNSRFVLFDAEPLTSRGSLT